MGLRVELVVRVKRLEKGKLEKVVKEARRACPSSRAVGENVETGIRVERA